MILVIITMPATGYTWKGDGIAPAGPLYCLYTPRNRHNTIMFNKEYGLKGGVRGRDLVY